MGSWIVDHVHSIVGFEVKHMMVSHVRGLFDSFLAEIDADDLTDLTTANIVFKIDTNSINTRNHMRDDHLKSADFFDVNRYPTIEFESKEISKSEGGYKVTGDLTIKDTTKPVTFDVVFGGKATDPWGKEVYGYVAEALINREDFGLTWNAALETGGVLVGKEVKIKAELEMHQPGNELPNATHVSGKPHKHEKTVEQAITRTDFHQMIAENITDMIAIIDKDGTIHYASPSFESILKEDLHALPDHHFFDNIHPDDREDVTNEIMTNASRTIKKEIKSEFKLRHSDGHYLNVEATMIMIEKHSLAKEGNELILIVMSDISDRKNAEEAIYHLAFHDTLTDLPNRRSFMNQLQSEIVNQKYADSTLSVFFVDLDNFKQINDQWGHDIGDGVLKEAAKRIQSAIRPTDVAGRFGGDEVFL